uniref:complement receptor type 1-like isoform X10 n=1 Tax=Gasterosteus aculeatus aculeatus TaxID=481459 RepID=UPI001A997F6A|nr:complement receptor type 1-like isoform X10 [Gasterosteus aculeatus aculeatus]
MDVTYVLLLSSLGLAQVIAQDCLIPVGGNNMGFKDDLPQTFPNGTKVSFECNVGYNPAGSPSITCTNGTWSPVKLTCERKSCGSAGEVENGDLNYEGTEFGDRLVVTCKTGYILVGVSQFTCGKDGWLGGRLPVCEAVACDAPPMLTNGDFSPVSDSYNYPEVVLYKCQKDYTMNGSSSSSCSKDGTFKPAPPTCIRVQCKDPDVTNGEWMSGARPPYKYKSAVTLQCIPGYNMNGAQTQRCELNSQWAPGLPTCEPVLCEDPDVKNAAKEEGSKPPYKVKSTVTFSCVSGYTMTGTRTQTCGLNGQWAPGLPTCEHDSGTVDPPENKGNGMAIGLGLGLTVLIGSVLTVLGCYFCGVPACIKEKKRSRRGFPVNAAPSADEEVALSVRCAARYT